MKLVKTLIKKLRGNRRKVLAVGVVLLLILSTLATYITFFAAKSAEAAWYNDSWHYRKKLVVDHTKVSGSTNLTNFPVLVSRTDTDLRDKAQSDGDDILFTDINGVKLDHEIENYNNSTGAIAAWVRVPTLYAAESTVIYMYYGNSASTNQQNPTGVWSSNYIAVWHLNETVTDEQTTGTHYDSTINNIDGTQNNNTNGGGQIANGQVFDGNADYINFGDINALDFGDTADFTISAWINVTSMVSDRTIVAKKNTSGTDIGYLLRVDDVANKIILMAADGGDLFTKTSTTAISTSTWYNVVAVWDQDSDTNTEIYINGNDDNGTNSGTIGNVGDMSNSLTFRIGAQENNDNYAYGTWDEIRIASTTLSSDWINTDYNNQYSSSTFFSSVGSEEKGPSPVLYFNFDEGTDNTCSGGSNDTCDQTSNRNDGLKTGAAWKPEDLCLTGKCLFFDGSDDEISVTNSSSIDLNGQLVGGFTIQAWIRVNSDGEGDVGRIFEKGSSTFMRVDSEGADGLADLEVSIDLVTTDATLNIADAITLNKWHHVAIAWSDDADDDATIYIDGLNKGTAAGSGSTEAESANLIIAGDSGTTANFHGFIDEFKIYKEEHSAAQIATDFERGSSSLHGSSARLGIRDYGYLSDGLVGYWKLDESSGSNATDSSGNGTTLTNVSTTAFTQAKFGRGMEPDGTADYLHAADNADLSQAGSLTLAAWIIPDDILGTENIIAKWDGTNESYRLTKEDANIRMYIDADANYQATTGSPLIANAVTHIAGVYDAPTATVRLYVNGILQTSSTTGTISTSIGDDTGQFQLGAEDHNNTPKNFFDGHIDEARVYNRTLTPTEVSALYNWGPGPVAYYNFDEGQGSSVYDKSTNSYTGSWQGTLGNQWATGKYGSTGNFNGSNNYVSTSNNLLGYDGMTFEMWIRPTASSSSWDYHVLYGANATLGGYTWPVGIGYNYDSSNRLAFFLVYNSGGNATSYQTTATGTYSLNTWYHLVGVLNGTSTYLYINGVLNNTGTLPGARVDTSANWSIQNVYNSIYRQAQIDEVKFYNYARTPAQIIEDMNAGHPAPGSPLSSAIGYWKYDEGYGDTAYDFSSQAKNGDLGYSDTTCPTSGDCPTWSNSGKFGKALSFDGFDDKVTSSLVTNATDNIAFSTWLNWSGSDSSSQNIYINGVASSNGWALRVDNSDNNELALICESIGTVTTNTQLTQGTWQHLVAQRNNGTWEIYLNARPITVGGSSTCTPNTPTTATVIGNAETGGSTNQGFYGFIDEVKIFNSALTLDQIKLLYNQSSSAVFGATSTDSSGNPTWSAQNEYCPPGQGSSCTAPVGEWKLNENTGTTAYDTSTNGSNGTISNNMWQADCQSGSCLKTSINSAVNDITITDPTSGVLDFSEDFTLEIWLKAMTIDGFYMAPLIKGASSTSDDGYKITIDETEVPNCYYTDGNGSGNDGASGTTSILDNKWHFITCVMDHDGGQIGTAGFHIFVDSKLENSGTHGEGSAASNANNLTLGEDAITREFDGGIDMVRIYNYARSPAQIAWDYNRGAPTGWWKFDECSGATAYDTSGKANNGTITPGAGTHTSVGTCNSGSASEMWDDGDTGKRNYSLDFDGSDDYVDMNDVNLLDFADNDDYTISAWINRETYTTDDTIVAKRNSDTNTDAGYLLWIDDANDDVNFEVSEGSNGTNDEFSINGTSTITATGWYHIVVVFDQDSATNSTVYINGLADKESTSGTIGNVGSLANSVDFRIGSESDNGNPFAGELDDIKVFNYALNATQVKALYNEGAVFYGPSTGSP